MKGSPLILTSEFTECKFFEHFEICVYNLTFFFLCFHSNSVSSAATSSASSTASLPLVVADTQTYDNGDDDDDDEDDDDKFEKESFES